MPGCAGDLGPEGALGVAELEQVEAFLLRTNGVNSHNNSSSYVIVITIVVAI